MIPAVTVLSNPKGFPMAIAQIHHWKIALFNPDHCHIRQGVSPQYLAFYLATIAQYDFHGVCPGHHMGIGHNQSIIAVDKSRASAPLNPFSGLLRHFAKEPFEKGIVKHFGKAIAGFDRAGGVNADNGGTDFFGGFSDEIAASRCGEFARAPLGQYWGRLGWARRLDRGLNGLSDRGTLAQEASTEEGYSSTEKREAGIEDSLLEGFSGGAIRGRHSNKARG
jgi:hypothetical protein